MLGHQLRPIERTVRRLRQEGLSNSEVAWRLRRSPGYVQRVETLSEIDRTSRRRSGDADRVTLRPIERCVLKALEGGSGYPEVAARLRRTPRYVSRIEEFANIRLEMGNP